MSDDDVTGRDLRTIWRTILLVFIGGSVVAGAVVAGIVREVRQDTRIEAVEKWQADRDAEEKAVKRMERWRRPQDPLKPTSFDIETEQYGTLTVFTEAEIARIDTWIDRLLKDREEWKRKAEAAKVCI